MITRLTPYRQTSNLNVCSAYPETRARQVEVAVAVAVAVAVEVEVAVHESNK
jgi:hypothetical protein